MNSRPFPSRRTLALACLLALALAPALPSSAAEIEVFRSSPSETAGSGFDARAALRIEPADGKALALNLRNLPPHTLLKIDAQIQIHSAPGLDLGAMVMADGRKLDPVTMPRNRLQIAVDGRSPAVNASFGGLMGSGGSFPDTDGHFLHLPGTGSAHGPIEWKRNDPEAAMGMIGGWDAEKMKKMSLHHLTFVVPHSADTATVEFSWHLPKTADELGIGIDPFSGPSSPFSIKSLSAHVLDSTVAMDLAQFSQRYEDLGSSDPTGALDALNDLVSAGPGILPMLRQKLAEKARPDLEAKFAQALAAMDDSNFQVRATAAKTLTDLGNDVVPLARKTLAENAASLSVETKSTLENLANSLEHGSFATAEHTRTNRLHRLLDTLGGPEAASLKSSLPAPKPVVAPEVSSMLDSLRQLVGGGAVDFGIAAEGADPFAPDPAAVEDPAAVPPDPFGDPPAPAPDTDVEDK